jgi:hypothetical protein
MLGDISDAKKLWASMNLSLRIAHTYKFVFCIRIDGL